MKFKDYCSSGGGRIVYMFNVAGYPWILTSSSSFDTDSTDIGGTHKLARIILGERNISNTIGIDPWYNAKWVHGVLQPPDKIKYSLDDDTGIINGGQFKIEVDRRWTGLDWSYLNWPDNFVGIPGLDFCPEVGSNDNLPWGYLTESVKSTDMSISVRDQSGGLMEDWITANSNAYVWIGNECIYVNGKSTGSDGELVLTVPNVLGLDSGRGIFRTRAQGHYLEETSGESPSCSLVPMGSIAGKACYLWATVVDDDGSVVLDEGAFCIAHGRVQPHVSIDDSRISIPVESWINHLKQDIPLKNFSAHLGGYFFNRGDEDTVFVVGEGNVNYMSGPHLYVNEYQAGGRTRHGVYLCEQNSSVFFRTKEDVLKALDKELEYCNTGSTSQVSGDGTAGNPRVNFTGELHLKKSESEPGRTIISAGLTLGSTYTQYILLSGPLAFMFDLCNFFTDEVETIKEALTTGWSVDTIHNGAPIFEAVPGDLEYTGSYDEPRIAANANFGDAAYWIQSNKDHELFRAFPKSNAVKSQPINYWCTPPVDSTTKMYLNPASDLGAISSLDYVQFGGVEDAADPYRALVGNVTDTGYDDGFPYLEFGSTTAYKWAQGFRDNLNKNNAPALARPDFTVDSPMRVQHSLYWFPDLEDDPWKITGDGITITSNKLSDIIQGILGFVGHGMAINSSNELNWVPDVNDDYVTEVDQIQSIDWDSFDDAFVPLMPGHYYKYTLGGNGVNILKILEGEMKLHGVHMTYEPNTLDVGGNWIIRFRKREDVNISQSYAQGRLINSSNITENDSQKMVHNKSWKFSEMLAKTNYNGKDYGIEFTVGSRFARNRVGGVVTQEIDAQISQLPVGKHGPTEATERTMYTHFVPLLVYSARDKPIVSKRLTSKSMYYINLGRDALLTDSTTYNVNTGQRGLTDRPCMVKGITYSLGKRDYGVDVDLALSSTGVYGWGPAMIAYGTFTTVLTEGVSGTVTINPVQNAFSRDGGRRDLSYFRNVFYNDATQEYEVGDTDPAFKVLVMSLNDPAWTPVQATISTFSSTYSSAVLTMDTSNFTISSSKIVEDLYIKFDTWDNLEDEQKRWATFSDSDNLIGTGDEPGHHWQT